MQLGKNFIKVISSPVGIFWILLGIAIILFPTYYFLDGMLVIGNLWYAFYLSEIILSGIISILFWVFLGASLYKIHYFRVQSTGTGLLWGFLWVLVAGCPACSITLASYIGLAGIISVFPFYGLELKVLSVLLLIFSNYSVLRNLEVCRVKKS